MYKGPAKNGTSRQDPAPALEAGTASAQLSRHTEYQKTGHDRGVPHSEYEAGKGKDLTFQSFSDMLRVLNCNSV